MGALLGLVGHLQEDRGLMKHCEPPGLLHPLKLRWGKMQSLRVDEGVAQGMVQKMAVVPMKGLPQGWKGVWWGTLLSPLSTGDTRHTGSVAGVALTGVGRDSSGTWVALVASPEPWKSESSSLGPTGISPRVPTSPRWSEWEGFTNGPTPRVAGTKDSVSAVVGGQVTPGGVRGLLYGPVRAQGLLRWPSHSGPCSVVVTLSFFFCGWDSWCSSGGGGNNISVGLPLGWWEGDFL